MSNDFRFDEGSHKYFLGAKELPSVTTILRDEGLIPSYYRSDEFYRKRGRAVHRMLELTTLNRFDKDNTAPSITRFHRGIVQYLEIEKPKVLMTEQIGYHRTGLFAGTVDQIVMWRDGSLAIVDAKSSDTASQPVKGTAYQTAAYALIAGMMQFGKQEPFLSLPPIDIMLPKVRRFGLMLWPDDGTHDICYKLVPYTSENDYNVFRSALVLNHVKKGRMK